MRRHRTFAFLVAGIVVGTTGCGGGGGLVKKPYMIIVGSAGGPVLRELQKTYLQQVYRSGQSIRGASMLVIDGQTTPADRMDDISAIDEALKAGVPVLCLNVGKEHLVQAAAGSRRIGAYMDGQHDGYLMTPTSYGLDIVHVGSKKFRAVRHKQHLDDNGHLTGSRDEQRVELAPTQEAYERFVANLKDRLAGRLPEDPNRGTDPPSSIPRYITSVQDSFTSVNDNVVPGQTITSNTAFFFNVYYNDGGAGNQYQWLIAYATGMSDPGSPSNNSERTKGYFQTEVNVALSPDPSGNGGLLSLVESQPYNSQDSYQSNIGANIQYNGGAASYPWSISIPPTPQQIPGWAVITFVNPAVPNSRDFAFFQQSPFDAIQDNWHSGFTYVGGLVLDYYPKSMNPTSTNQFPIYVGGTWRTSTTTDQGIIMQYAVGAQYELLHAREKSPGIYDRDRTIVNFNPDPSNITLLFGRAS